MVRYHQPIERLLINGQHINPLAPIFAMDANYLRHVPAWNIGTEEDDD